MQPKKIGTPDFGMLSNMPISIDGKVYNYDPSAFLIINPSRQGLNEALARLPGDFAHWAFLESLARLVAEETEGKVERKRAKLYHDLEKKMTIVTSEGKTKYPSVDSIKAAVTLDEEYQRLLKEQREATQAVNNMMSMRQAMNAKREVILAIARNYAYERESGMADQMAHLRDKVHAARAGVPLKKPEGGG